MSARARQEIDAREVVAGERLTAQSEADSRLAPGVGIELERGDDRVDILRAGRAVDVRIRTAAHFERKPAPLRGRNCGREPANALLDLGREAASLGERDLFARVVILAHPGEDPRELEPRRVGIRLLGEEGAKGLGRAGQVADFLAQRRQSKARFGAKLGMDVPGQRFEHAGRAGIVTGFVELVGEREELRRIGADASGLGPACGRCRR